MVIQVTIASQHGSAGRNLYQHQLTGPEPDHQEISVMTQRHEFHFHEDEVGQTQVLPIEWWSYCEGEFEALKAHDVIHRVPDGAGWSEMYEFRPADPGLPRLDMTEQRFVALLQPQCRQFDVVESNLAEVDARLGIRAIGFGPSGSAGVIAEVDGDRLAMIWGRLFASQDDERAVLVNLLTALSTDQHLMLVDWPGNEMADLRNHAQLDAYLRGESGRLI